MFQFMVGVYGGYFGGGIGILMLAAFGILGNDRHSPNERLQEFIGWRRQCVGSPLFHLAEKMVLLCLTWA